MAKYFRYKDISEGTVTHWQYQGCDSSDKPVWHRVDGSGEIYEVMYDMAWSPGLAYSDDPKQVQADREETDAMIQSLNEIGAAEYYAPEVDPDAPVFCCEVSGDGHE